MKRAGWWLRFWMPILAARPAFHLSRTAWVRGCLLAAISKMRLPVRRAIVMAGAIDDDCLSREFKTAAAKIGKNLRPGVAPG